MSQPRVVIVPGNGIPANGIYSSNWYNVPAIQLKAVGLFSEVILYNMPDSITAREEIWVPFLLNECKADEKSIIIGHSSGAEACMRLLEKQKLFGAVLVSVCHTDLGDEHERIAG